MIIPSKHSGYQAGIRLYPGGSGGGGGIFGGSPPSPNLGYNQQGQLTPVNQLGPGFRNGLFGGFDNTPYSGPQFAPTPQTPPSGYRPTGDQQFYQPVYQQQYQNYNMGNPMSTSQYGQQQFQQFAKEREQYTQSSPIYKQLQQLSNQFGAGNPPTLDQQNQMKMLDQQLKNDPTIQGFQKREQDIQSQIPDFMGSAPYSISGPRPQQAQQQQTQQQYQNYNMGNPMSMSQYGQPPSYGGGYGGGMGGYGGGYDGGFMPQMQSSFNYQQPQQTMARPNYGPSQPIVSRSAQMRGTPNVMRRAEGGITSLLGKDE